MEENRNIFSPAGNVLKELEELHKLDSIAKESIIECVITSSGLYTIICC